MRIVNIDLLFLIVGGHFVEFIGMLEELLDLTVNFAQIGFKVGFFGVLLL